MGNAPLSPPPPATLTRVVVPICTRSKFLGVSLHVIHKDTDENTQDANNVSLPAPLCGTPISQQAYQEKLQLLQQRLTQWKGGWATLALILVALAVVLAFVAAYFVPEFWSSVLFSDPTFILAIAAFQIVFFTIAVKYIKKQSTSLQRDITQLYREWRRHGVYVTVKPVDGTGIIYGGQRLSGSNCFCVVMDVLNEAAQQQQQHDDGSVATVDTDNSQDSIIADDNYNNEECPGIELTTVNGG